MPKQILGSATKNRVGRVTGNSVVVFLPKLPAFTGSVQSELPGHVHYAISQKHLTRPRARISIMGYGWLEYKGICLVDRVILSVCGN